MGRKGKVEMGAKGTRVGTMLRWNKRKLLNYTW